MKKVLPLNRWKKEKPPDRECFSDEDSDEEDSDYEEVVISKKNQAKRKRGANEAASSKRIKPNPKPQIRIPKKSVPRTMPNKQAPKKRPRASMDPLGPPPGAPPLKRFKPNQLKPSSIPSPRQFEGEPTVYYCDYVTNVTYKIQYKYPDGNFSKAFYRMSKQNIPMAEILSELKKGNAGS